MQWSDWSDGLSDWWVATCTSLKLMQCSTQKSALVCVRLLEILKRSISCTKIQWKTLIICTKVLEIPQNVYKLH